MTTNSRFINSIITSAQSQDIAMPWTRGTARRSSIARRRTISQMASTAVAAAAKRA